MYKLKFKKSFSKRFLLISNKNFKRHSSNKNHFLINKKKSKKNYLYKNKFLSKFDFHKFKKFY